MRFFIGNPTFPQFSFYLLTPTKQILQDINRLGPVELVASAYDWPQKTYDYRGWTDSVNSLWYPHGSDDFSSCVVLLDDTMAAAIEACIAAQVAATASGVSPRPNLILSAMLAPTEGPYSAETYLPSGFNPAAGSTVEEPLIEWLLYPLVPIKVTELPGGERFSGLWFLPLVDLRYFWRTTALLPLTGGTTTSQVGTAWPKLAIDHRAIPDWMPNLRAYPQDAGLPADYVPIADNGTHPAIEGNASRDWAADQQADMEGWRIVNRDVRSGYNAPLAAPQHTTFTGILSDYPDPVSSTYTATSATVDNAGIGYTVLDEVTVVGGTGTAATFSVTTVGGSGEVTAITVKAHGSYTEIPDNPVTVTGGTGVCLRISVTYTRTYVSANSYHNDAIRLWDVFSGNSNMLAGGVQDLSTNADLMPTKLAFFFKVKNTNDYYQITIEQLVQDPVLVSDLAEDTTGLGTDERLYIPKVFLGPELSSDTPSDDKTYSAVSATVSNGGAGYVDSATVTVSGGTNTSPATFTVTVRGGIVICVTIDDPGLYTVVPTNPVMVDEAGGLELDVVWSNTESVRDALVTAAKQWAILYWRWRRKPCYLKFPRIAPVIPNGYAHMIRWDFADLADLSTTYIALYGVFGTDDRFGSGSGGSGSSDGFWVRLTKKTYTEGEFTKYDWTRVVDSDDPTPLEWEYGGQSGTADDNPIYEVNNIDLPVNDLTGGGGAGSGSGSGSAGDPLIAWARPGMGEYYLIDMVPRWEFVEQTGEPDENGIASATLIRYDQDSKDWVVVEPCLLLDANSA